MKKWISRLNAEDARPPESYIDSVVQRCGISPRLARLLWMRGIRTPVQLDEYLNPGLRHLCRPELWPGMAAAADLLAEGLCSGRKLAVWGDYDVDGVTGTALVLQVLAHYGFDALWHLPDRKTEGYGMNLGGVEDLGRAGAGMLLTVDCGISDCSAIARAKAIGMTVIVSDHHLPPEKLPEADVLCNPKLSECPCPSLAGVGVAFFLMAAVSARLAQMTGIRKFDMRSVLDLVALGTLADLVELEGQNRVLVKNGLLVVGGAARPGIAELKAVSGFTPTARLGSTQVVFSLAPRINAAGRVASAETALKLMCTGDAAEAAALAGELDAFNAERRGEEERIASEAVVQAEEEQDAAAVIVCGADWNQGVIGIVASRLVEKYHRPAIVFCKDGPTLKGSGRSIPGFDLHDGLGRCASDLLAFGGHRMAAGLRLAPGMYETFRKDFRDVVRDAFNGDPPVPALVVDDVLDFKAASDFIFLKELEMMQPFGVGNPEPVFSSPPLVLKKRRLFGPRRDHAMLELYDESCGITLSAKAWRRAQDFPAEMEGCRLKLAFSPAIDMYNGAATVNLKIKDWEIL